MAVETMVTNIHAALVSWTYLLLFILLIAKIIQAFKGAGSGNIARERTETETNDRRPGDTRETTERTDAAAVPRRPTITGGGMHTP